MTIHDIDLDALGSACFGLANLLTQTGKIC
jgi:hypothetical protein